MSRRTWTNGLTGPRAAAVLTRLAYNHLCLPSGLDWMIVKTALRANPGHAETERLSCLIIISRDRHLLEKGACWMDSGEP